MNDNMKVSIGKELQKLRIDSEVTVEEICEKSHVNKDTLYRYEAGQGASFEILEKILNAYEISYYIFFKRIYDTMQN